VEDTFEEALSMSLGNFLQGTNSAERIKRIKCEKREKNKLETHGQMVSKISLGGHFVVTLYQFRQVRSKQTEHPSVRLMLYAGQGG